MINLNEKTCVIYERQATGPRTAGNIVGAYYIATDKETNECIGADISKDVLINRLHQECGYHKFDIKNV